MRNHYDFSKMKSKKNSYAKALKTPVTIRLDKEIIEYFKALTAKTGLPYQNLINSYLRECVITQREPKMVWSA